MGTAVTSIASGVWQSAGSMLNDLGPIIGIFVGLSVAIFVASKIVSMVKSKD
jgi:hypothetical protein